MGIAFKNQIKLRKKYSNLNRQAKLFEQIYGPKTISTNFVFDNWSSALSGFFVRHGNRRFSETYIENMLKATFWELKRQQRTCWVLELRESHFKPDFLYSNIRARFPEKSEEEKKLKISKLKKKLVAETVINKVKTQQKPLNFNLQKTVKMEFNMNNSMLTYKNVLKKVPLELISHYQTTLNWENPSRLFVSPSYLAIFIQNSLFMKNKFKNYSYSKLNISKSILQPVSSKNTGILNNTFPTKSPIFFFKKYLKTMKPIRTSYKNNAKNTQIKKTVWFKKKKVSSWKKNIFKIKQIYNHFFWNEFKSKFIFQEDHQQDNKEDSLDITNVNNVGFEDSSIYIQCKNWPTSTPREPRRLGFYYSQRNNMFAFWKNFSKWNANSNFKKKKFNLVKQYKFFFKKKFD